jgi:hypothetical protein
MAVPALGPGRAEASDASVAIAPLKNAAAMDASLGLRCMTSVLLCALMIQPSAMPAVRLNPFAQCGEPRLRGDFTSADNGYE